MKKDLLIVGVVLILSTFVGCASLEVPTITSAQSTASVNTPITTAQTTEISTSIPEETKAPLLEIGNTVTIYDWEITLDSVEIVKKIEGNYETYFEPDEGNEYFVAHITIKNTGINSKEFLPMFSMESDVRVNLKYQDKYDFNATQLIGHSEDLHSTYLNPLSSKSGIIAFDIVDDAANSLDKVVLNFTYKDEIYSFKIK